MAGLSDIVKIDCGAEFTMALDKNGRLLVFGSNSYGQLGITMKTNKVNEAQEVYLAKCNSKVVDFTCGEEHAAFVDENGQVFTWGFGVDGQLGHGNKNSVNVPTLLKHFKEPARLVKCGAGNTGIVTRQGQLYLMGRGRDGQLGRASHLESVATERTKPTLVDHFTSQKLAVEQLAIGGNHTLAVARPKV